MGVDFLRWCFIPPPELSFDQGWKIYIVLGSRLGSTDNRTDGSDSLHINQKNFEMFDFVSRDIIPTLYLNTITITISKCASAIFDFESM